MQIDELTDAVPHHLQMFYPAVFEGTILEGSKLIIENIEALVFCTNSGTSYSPTKVETKCHNCQSEQCNVIDGNNIFVFEIGIDAAS